LLRGSLVVLLLSMLAACRAKDTDTLKPQDAARWLHQTCGIAFAQNPVVLKSTSAALAARRGSSVSVSATVVLPSAEVAPALESLGKNRSLHRRGQSESRYSYESIPEARPEKECEFDTSLHVLFFRYTE
jgi:hypothetical protein